MRTLFLCPFICIYHFFIVPLRRKWNKPKIRNRVGEILILMLMTNKIRTIIPLLAVVALLSSCAQFKQYAYTSRTAPISNTTVAPQTKGVEVEMDFARHVTATSEVLPTEAEAIAHAKYLCLQNNHIDVLVDPIFHVEKMASGYRAIVHGYAGMYKTASTGAYAVQESEISMENIEKYKLLSDPSFAQHYYKQFEPEKHITTYNISAGGNERVLPVVTTSEPEKNAPKSLIIQAAAPTDPKIVNPKFDYYKAKKLSASGWGFFTMGALFLGLGGGMLGGSGNSDGLMISGAVFMGVGAASMLYVGVPMICVGSYRMRRAPNRPKAEIAVGGTNNGLGMALKF